MISWHRVHRPHLAEWIIATLLFSSGLVFSDQIVAPPSIDEGGVWNAAGHVPPSLAGGALARGARFIITGVRLGPHAEVKAGESDPPASLAGVTVRIADANAALFSVSAERIEGWLPASTPLGTMPLQVTYEGRTSEPYDLTVVDSSFQFFSDQPVSTAPGETLTLRGSGLGGGELEVFVGGRPASGVHAAGPAPGKGIDLLSFQVPSDAPLGCAVPVMARGRAGGRLSNVIAIQVHPPGQPCSDSVDWFRETVERAANAGFVVLAHASIAIFGDRQVGKYDFDYAIGSFGRQESGQRQFPPLPPPHTCTVFTERLNLRQWTSAGRSPSAWPSLPQKSPGNRRLDAGPSLTIGPKELPRNPHTGDSYDVVLGGRVPFSHRQATPLFLSPGAYTVSAPGGADVGAFSVPLKVRSPLLWKNRRNIAAVDRAKGVTLEWKASHAQDAILVVAASSDHLSGDSAMCLCMVPAKDGRFTVPPLFLGNLPPNANRDNLGASYLGLLEMPVQPPARIQARGLDAAFAAFVSLSARPVAYK